MLCRYFVDVIELPSTFEQLRTTAAGTPLRILVDHLAATCTNPAIVNALLYVLIRKQFTAICSLSTSLPVAASSPFCGICLCLQMTCRQGSQSHICSAHPQADGICGATMTRTTLLLISDEPLLTDPISTELSNGIIHLRQNTALWGNLEQMHVKSLLGDS